MASKTEQPRDRAVIIRRVLIDLSVLAMIGIVLALIAPFDSFRIPLAWRLIYWVGLSMTGYFCYSPLSLAVPWAGEKLDLPEPPLWIVAIMLGTIPMAIIVWTVGYLPGPVALPTLEQAFEHYFYVLVVGAGITFVFELLSRPKEGAVAASVQTSAPVLEPIYKPEPAAAVAGASVQVVTDTPIQPLAQPVSAEEPQQARFLGRLSPALGTDLVALEMEDHYVRVHTALGSDLILMRMRDAVAELGEMEGSQVHRSWWVAKAAVHGMRREGRNIRLQLTGGLEAPVSRNMVPQLKDGGWW